MGKLWEDEFESYLEAMNSMNFYIDVFDPKKEDIGFENTYN